MPMPSADPLVTESSFQQPGAARAGREELETAFRMFSSLSLRLEEAYGDLEARVASLDEQLRVARQEREIQRAEKEHIARRMAGLMAELPAGVVLIGPGGRVEDANPAACRMLDGLSTGAHWETVVHGNLVGSVESGGDAGDMVLGRQRRITLTRRELGSDTCVIVLTDVTRIHELEQRVGRNQRLSEMGEMAARLAHQIRTPVASAMLLASGLTGAEEQSTRRSASRILERLRHLETMINDMLTFARGGMGEVERLSVRDLIHQAVHSVGPEAERRIHMAVPDGQSATTTLANREMVAGAIANLINNALEWSTGSIKLSGRASAEGYLEIAVADDGPGIPAEIAERIFEPFFTTRSGGTGLGLAVVRSVAETFGGSVHQEPGPSGGAVFRLRLPIDAGCQSGRPAPAAEGAQG